MLISSVPAALNGMVPRQRATCVKPMLTRPSQPHVQAVLRIARVAVMKTAPHARGVSCSATEDWSDRRTGNLWQLIPGEVLQGKYTINKVLGSGSNATAYEATTPDGASVALKALSLRGMRDWKQLEMFQREGKVLASLNHPSIPNYIDYFEVDNEKDRSFYIVQELAEGESLAQMVESGMRCDEKEATRIGLELLKTLDYLSGLRPPVVHRDIKPENIVLEGGTWGGRVYLIDFGGVQAVRAAGDASAMASTIVGTYGYMAPEQFRGAVQPASDLYSLGATLLFLLTGQSPSTFPQERMKIQWQDSGSAPTSAKWSSLLDGLLEPLSEDRLNASEALAVLEGKQVAKKQGAGGSVPSKAVANGDSSFKPSRRQKAKANPSGAYRGGGNWVDLYERLNNTGTLAQPAGSRVILERSGARLDITIPPKGLSTDTAFTGVFAIAWNAFVAFWTFGALASGGVLFALFSAPFWFAGAQLGKQAFGAALMRERFAIGRNKFKLAQELALLNQGEASFEGDNEQSNTGPTSELVGARVVTTMIVNGEPQTAIEILQGVNRFKFGEGLEIVEQQWISQQINEHLRELKGSEVDFGSMPTPEEPKFFNDEGASASSSSFDTTDPFNDPRDSDPFWNPNDNTTNTTNTTTNNNNNNNNKNNNNKNSSSSRW